MSASPDGMREFLLRRKPERVAVQFHDDRYGSSNAIKLVEVLDDGLVIKYGDVERVVPFTAIKYIQLEKK